MSPKAYREAHPGVIPDEYVEIANRWLNGTVITAILFGFVLGIALGHLI